MRRIVYAGMAAGLTLAGGVHGQVVVGLDEGGLPLARTYNPLSPNPPLATVQPTTPSFTGGVRVAVGDINGDGTGDLVTGLGAGATGHVKVFSGYGGPMLIEFDAYGVSYTGGVFVGAGDVNNDGHADVITGTGAGSPPHVKAFSGAGGSLLASFLAFPSFTGGVTVAAGDVDGDGRDDIIVGAASAVPHVKVFSGATGAEIRSFLAFPGFPGGVFVASGDVDGNGRDDIIVGAGEGAAGGHVKVFDGATNALIASFLAYPGAFAGGVRVGAVDRNGDGVAEIVTGTGPGSAPHVRVFTNTGTQVASFLTADIGFTGGIFVAGFDSGCYADCNGDGALTVADFGCFQTKFVSGSSYADCNGDGVRTVADFGCFQTKFVQGCP